MIIQTKKEINGVVFFYTYEGKHYISLIDGNVYSPTAYPAGWQEQA